MWSLPIPQHVISDIPDDLITLVLDGVSSHHSRRAYQKALKDFLLWCGDAGVRAFNRGSVQKYKAELERRGFAPPRSANDFRLSASSLPRLPTMLCWPLRSRPGSHG